MSRTMLDRDHYCEVDHVKKILSRVNDAIEMSRAGHREKCLDILHDVEDDLREVLGFIRGSKHERECWVHHAEELRSR